MFQKAQLFMVALSAIGSLTAALIPGGGNDDRSGYSSRPEQPHFVSSPAKPKAEADDESFRGAGYSDYDIDKRVGKLEEAIKLVSGGKSAAAKPAVESKTTAVDQVTVKAGQTPEEIVKALQAAGYKANVTYSAASYGSSGSSATYSSGGSSGGSVARSYSYGQPYNVSYGDSPYVEQTYSYAQPQATYSYPVQTYAQPATATTYRTGLFGRVYSTQSAQPTCRVVNGQVICN